MKFYRKTFVLLSSCMIIASCHGTIDPDGNDPDTADVEYIISVDKTQIEADGIDKAVLTLKDSEGNDLTATDLGRVYFKIEETQELLPRRTREYTAFENGTVTVSGSYNGIQCTNTVQITAANRSKYEVFHKNVGLYKCTGTPCTYCPSLTAAINALDDKIKEHVLVLACHSNLIGSDPFSIDFGNMDLGTYLLYQFDPDGGLPYLVVNMYEGTTDRSVSNITDLINKQRKEFPATSGIKVKTSYSGNNLNIDATLKSSTGDSYNLGCALLLDNQYYQSPGSSDGNYSNIVRAVTDNFIKFSRESAFDVEKDGEYTKNFSLEVSDLEKNKADSRIVVFSMRTLEDGSTVVDNLVSCGIDAEIDYVYNE